MCEDFYEGNDDGDDDLLLVDDVDDLYTVDPDPFEEEED
jgi:hypothetical protein